MAGRGKRFEAQVERMRQDPQAPLRQAASQVIRYYGHLWTEPERFIHHGPPEKIAAELRQYHDAGIDELIVFLEIPELRQLELFARARELAGCPIDDSRGKARSSVTSGLPSATMLANPSA